MCYLLTYLVTVTCAPKRNFSKFCHFSRRSESSDIPFITVANEKFHFQSQTNNQYIYLKYNTAIIFYMKNIWLTFEFFPARWAMALVFQEGNLYQSYVYLEKFKHHSDISFTCYIKYNFWAKYIGYLKIEFHTGHHRKR